MNMHIEWAQNQKRISELISENAQLREIINAHNKKMSDGVYTTNEQCAKEVAEHDRLLAENEAQSKRIAELEEHVTKLGSGSRQHLYQAFARRYKEILSLRRENEALRKQVEAYKEVDATDKPKNGDSK